MKRKLLITLATILLFLPQLSFGQVTNLGTAADFVLFSSVGAVSNTGITHLTGNVGTNGGSSTGFGNVDGVMHDNDGASGQCATDLLAAYNQLNSDVPTFFPASLLGNGQILNAGVYSISSPATLNLDLTLDGQGNSSAVFIFQIQGSFSTNTNSKIKLINGALACNVFWKVEGLVSMATGTTMRGTVIANNAAINMNTGDTLEGRALSTTGAVSVDGVLAYTPIGCGSPLLTGPVAPTLASVACYTIFSSIGPVTNSGVTNVTGDVGSNNGLTTGFNPLLVNGTIHATPDASTAACASDLTTVYNYLNGLPYDIELLYPAQFGNNLVLTPHTYVMNAAVTFTDTLYLNAEGDANAVFVIQVNGAFSTSTYSKVNLINGAQAKNVYWEINGAVNINDYSVFNGTIICNNGALSLYTGVLINGRVLTTTGAVNTTAITAIMTPGCGNLPPNITSEPNNQTICSGDSVSFTVTATGSGLTYQWRKGNVNLVNGGNISGATSDTLTINPVTAADAATNYNVIVTGSFSPSDTSTDAALVVNQVLAVLSSPTVNGGFNISCNGNSDGSITLAASGGTAPYTYSWTGPNGFNSANGNISGLSAGTYSVVTTDANGCSAISNITLTEPALLTASIAGTNILCNSSSSGAADLTVTGGTSPYTYSWSNAATTQDIFGITAGTYSVTITDANGCIQTASVTLTQSPALTISESHVDVLCNGLFTGSIDITITGGTSPYTYSWSTGATTQDISGITAGTYSVNITDANGCTQSTSVTVTQSTTLSAAITSPLQSDGFNVSSSGGNDGSANVVASGGTSPYTYSWSNGATTPNVNGLAAGTYTVIITDANGCSVTETIILDEPMALQMPTGYSPNGDGQNDYFVVHGIEAYPNNHLEIFNRWGNLVFSADHYNNTWNGYNNSGDKLSDGTYFVVLTINDGNLKLTGYVDLRR